eukprot:TRINITY_DN1380_c0_g1_i4.p1 TRINITY_DN1380_c0_g1~~TRINITY_DN1380_c0_g1_i4.p1  ORF type:complete len:253 (-),score=66.99 TRINITY_DN1380_c0_g1_i4:100-858(-)
MPLPPALASRLAKRGILPKDELKKSVSLEEEEEVIAESYDPEEESPKVVGKGLKGSSKGLSAEEKTARTLSYPGCPNKVNPHHLCTLFCLNRWGKGKLKPEDGGDYKAKYDAMMKRIQLPDHWREKYDPGSGRHYFWCTRTDKVSWLPPGHPKSRPVEAASVLRELYCEREMEEDSDKSEDEDKDDMDLDSDSEDEDHESRRRRERPKKERYRGSHRGESDPMDPSAYSDTPKGNWSAGLDEVRGISKRSKP